MKPPHLLPEVQPERPKHENVLNDRPTYGALRALRLERRRKCNEVVTLILGLKEVAEHPLRRAA